MDKNNNNNLDNNLDNIVPEEKKTRARKNTKKIDTTIETSNEDTTKKITKKNANKNADTITESKNDTITETPINKTRKYVKKSQKVDNNSDIKIDNTSIDTKSESKKPTKKITKNVKKFSTLATPSWVDNTPIQPNHLTANSPWPFIISFSVLSILTGFVFWFNDLNNSGKILLLGLTSVITIYVLWNKDIITEGTFLGLHTQVVQSNLTIGVGLFILTEACVFFSVFWAYFHSSLAPTVEIGSVWPPISTEALNPFAIPLLNTILLLSSGASVTFAHHAIFMKNRKNAILGTVITVVIATVFTLLQVYEYQEAGFTIADGVFGTCFYASTGTHGLHVVVGTTFIVVGLIRIISYHLTDTHHVGYEASILYWHFVDVVWLFLYAAVYIWGTDIL